MTVFRLPVFYKQRDFLFYPAWAFAMPIWVLRIPVSLIESGIWIVLTYYTIGFAPAASRFFKQFLALFGVHQMALSLSSVSLQPLEGHQLLQTYLVALLYSLFLCLEVMWWPELILSHG